MIALVVTSLYFGVIGNAAASLLRFRLPGSRLERFGQQFLLGVGTSGTALFLAGICGAPIGLPLCLALFFAALLVSWLRRNRGDGERKDFPSQRLALAVMMIPLLFAMWDAIEVPLQDWDGRAFWVLKGKAIAHERSVTGRFFQGLGARNLHSEYPLLLPLADAAVFHLMGDDDDKQIRPLYVLIALSLLLTIRAGVGRNGDEAMGAWLAAIAAWLPQFAVTADGSILSAYSDIPLAAFATAGLLQIEDDPRALQVGCWAAFALQTKNEGVVIAIALLLCLAIRCSLLEGVQKGVRRVALAALPVGTVVALLAVWRSMIPLEYDENYGDLVKSLPERTSALLPAAKLFLAKMFVVRQWGLFWIAVAVASIVSLRRWRTSIVPLAFIALCSAAYVVAYAVSSWVLRDLVNASADRLLLHLAGAAVLVLAEAARRGAAAAGERQAS